MGLFKRIDNSLYDYLDKEIDMSKIKAVCSSEINGIAFMKLAINIVSTYIASAISTCEFKVYNKDGPIKDTIYYKLNIAPNPNDTATRLKYVAVKELIHEGRSLVVQYKNNLYFAETFGYLDKAITGYRFDGVTIQETPINKEFTRKNSFYFELDDEEITRLLLSIDDKYTNLISKAIKVYNKAISNKWKVKIDSMKQHDPEFEEEFNTFVTEQLKEFITSDEAVYPELNGYILEHLDEGDTKTDSSDIRNLRKDIFDMVAQAYKMPPSMMYGNVTNLKEVVNQFIAFAIKPYATMIGEEITRTLFSETEILSGCHVEVDISSINYRDIFDIANGIDKLISDGIANIDETRRMVNLPILNTEFSKQYWMTKNYSKVEDMMKEVEENNKSSTSSNDDDNVSDNISDNIAKGGDVDEEQ